jgi:hypothetical protein
MVPATVRFRAFFQCIGCVSRGGGDFVNLMLRDSCSIEYANFFIATNRRFIFFSANIESAQE